MRLVAQRVVVALLTIVVALGIAAVITRVRDGDPGGMPSASPSLAPSTSVTLPTSTASSPALVNFCGTVTRYAADGAHMLLTLAAGTVSQQFNLQYQFAQRTPPTDIGDRFARGESQLLRVVGRESVPDSGSPGAITLRDYLVERVTACP